MLSRTEVIPLPALPTITTRVATMADLPFVDALQKKHSKQLGFFPRQQIEGYLKNGWMRVAEERVESGELRVERMQEPSTLSTLGSPLFRPVGYIAFRDRYQKRDELGAVFQLCVEPGRQRGLIGATLLQSAFDASAYGCKLFCCWCAQDLPANRFWESMGFVPIAYRAGSERKSRVHIFWQKRIRAGDAATPWWYPSGTDGGALRSGRLVLPIPPGTHWSEVKPIVLAGSTECGVESTERKPKRLPSPKTATPTTAFASKSSISMGGLRFASPVVEKPVVEKPKRERAAKLDPRVIAAARELRDRWMEHVNDGAIVGAGKYDVSRRMESRATVELIEPATTLLLAA